MNLEKYVTYPKPENCFDINCGHFEYHEDQIEMGSDSDVLFRCTCKEMAGRIVHVSTRFGEGRCPCEDEEIPTEVREMRMKELGII